MCFYTEKRKREKKMGTEFQDYGQALCKCLECGSISVGSSAWGICSSCKQKEESKEKEKASENTSKL